jgi:hypothetical protein
VSARLVQVSRSVAQGLDVGITLTPPLLGARYT